MSDLIIINVKSLSAVKFSGLLSLVSSSKILISSRMRRATKAWLVFLCVFMIFVFFAFHNFNFCFASLTIEKSSEWNFTSTESFTEDKESEWEWVYDILVVCPWGEGGGADTTLQAFRSAFIEINGIEMEIEHKTGSGGIAGLQYALTYPADGYFYLLGTESLILEQIRGETDYDVYGSIHPLVRLVHDVNIFITWKDAQLRDYEEIYAYSENNPGEITCGVMSLMGLDSACIEAAFGENLDLVTCQDGAEMLSGLENGVLDLAICGPSEFSSALSSGDLHIVFSCTENPIVIYEYVDMASTSENLEIEQSSIPCAGELGIDCYYGPGRGIFYKEGTPQEAIEAFETAAKKAVDSESFNQFIKEQSLDLRPGWLGLKDYQEYWESEYIALSEMFGENEE